jgi:hypothetical protein
MQTRTVELRRGVSLAWLALAALAIGCQDAPPPKPRVAAKPVTPAAAASASDAPATGESAPLTGSAEPTAPATAGDAQAAALDKSADEPKAELEVPAERVAILTPGGPVLVDVRLTLDGQPQGAGLQRLVEKVLAAADSDGDGRPTWKELVDNRAALPDQTRNENRGDSMLLAEWSEKHDVNRDGRVQPDEAASWLGRDANRTARAFALRTSRAFAPDPRVTSRLWPLFDADRDGRLSEAELDGAAARLWLRDADDDRIIALSELASLRDQLDATMGMPMDRRNDGRSASVRVGALHLEPKSDLERVDYILKDMYAPLQDLAPSSFAALPALFGQLDADGDEWVGQDEWTNLRTVPAHVVLDVTFDRAATRRGEPPTIAVRCHGGEVAEPAAMAADRLVLKVGSTRLVAAVQDLLPVAPSDGRPERDPEAFADEAPLLAETQVRLVVHDQSDALFDELDANADGRLGEREIATARERLLRYDADGDRQLSPEETPYEMIVAFVRGEALNEESFSTPPSRGMTPTGAAPDWFAFADLNRDGDVSRREFVGSVERFESLDADGDGFITADEASPADES